MFTIVGGIYSGIFTAGEAGAIGAFMALVLALARGKKAFPEIRHGVWDAMASTSMIFIIILSAFVFSNFLSVAGVPRVLLDFVFKGGLSPYTVLAMYCLLMALMGCFMSATACILITVPFAHPAIVGLGFDGVWFGVVIVQLTELAVITPPVAMNIFAMKGLVPEVELAKIYKSVTLFVILDFVILACLIAFPQISLWLPSVMKF